MDQLKSRWMKRKDLESFPDRDHILNLIGTKRNIAAVIENDKEVLGCVVYKVLSEVVLILKISFFNEDHIKFMLEEIKCKFSKNISLCVSEYDTRLHLALNNAGFIATRITKNKERDCDFYVFEWIAEEALIP